MSEISRRHQARSRPGGKVIGTRQRLVDRGDGNIFLLNETVSEPCPNCRHPISDISEIRGRCQACSRISTCSYCDVLCRACSRRLCGGCRRGFVSQSGVHTVCPVCLPKLNRQRDIKLQQQQQKLAMQASVIRHREWLRHQQALLQAAQFREQQKLQRLKLLLSSRPSPRNPRGRH